MNMTLKLAATAVALAGLAACSTQPAGYPDAPTPRQQEKVESLQDYHWALLGEVAADNSDTAPPVHGPEGKPLTLNFSEQQVSVDGLCNLLNGTYTITKTDMRITSPVSTMKACADQELMAYERQVSQKLPTVSGWSMAKAESAPNNPAPILTLTFADGSKWRLQGKPTANTRYGGTPQRVFLEVAPQREPCAHPTIPNYQCLKVREVFYTEQGLQTGAGPWKLYADTIEGYEHEPGVRNVLRVNRYTLQNQPAGAPNQADVLDMVVVSDRAQP